jgi:hypothetical protein
MHAQRGAGKDDAALPDVDTAVEHDDGHRVDRLLVTTDNGRKYNKI